MERWLRYDSEENGMTVRTNDARASTLADGTVITNANAPFTDNFNAITTSGGGTAVMETTPKTYIFSAPDAGTARGDWTINSPRAVVVALFDFTNVSSILDNRIIALFNTSQNAGMGVNLVSGQLRIADFTGASKLLTTQTVYGKLVRVYVGMEIGTGTTDGELHFKAFFDTDWNSATQGSASTGATYDSAVANVGTTNFTQIRVGKIGSGNAVSVPMVYVTSNDAIYTDLGPLASSNSAPIVNAGADQTNIEPGATVTITVTASDPDGTTPTVTLAQTSGTPTVVLTRVGTTNVWTFPAPATIAGTTLTFTATATDGVLSATDPMTVSVLPATERAAIGGVMVPVFIRDA